VVVTNTTDFNGANTNGAIGLPATLPNSPPPASPPISGVNFSGQNLQNHNFSGENLRGANFSGANLQGAIFDNADLTGANFASPTKGNSTNLQSATFKGTNLTNANFTGANLQHANFDPPAAGGLVSASAASGGRQKNHGYERHVVAGADGGDARGHRHGTETGAPNGGWRDAASAHHVGHVWNGHPQAGAFNRYIMSGTVTPGTVTGPAVWHHHHHLQQQQPGGTAGGASGFTRYVISGNTGNTPRWLQPGSGDAPGMHHRQWLKDGVGAAEGTTHPRWTRQGNTADGANRPRWLGRDGERQAHNASALNRFSNAMHGWWRNHQPLWAGGARAGDHHRPGGQRPPQSPAPPKK